MISKDTDSHGQFGSLGFKWDGCSEYGLPVLCGTACPCVVRRIPDGGSIGLKRVNVALRAGRSLAWLYLMILIRATRSLMRLTHHILLDLSALKEW